MVMSSSPEPMLVEMFAGLSMKRLGCHADPYTVSRVHTRGESEDHTGKNTCKGSTLALKPRADITRSSGFSGPTKRTYVPSKNVKKNITVKSANLIYFPTICGTSCLNFIFFQSANKFSAGTIYGFLSL